MNKKLLILFGEISALNAEVEGMKAENIERNINGLSPVYGEEAFFEKCDKIREIIKRVENDCRRTY